jgi:4-amino-4-deoxy-L-arabinose transferase-like glycosyltransferase
VAFALLAPSTPRVSSRRFVVGVVAAVVVLRVGYVVGPLFSDEAGFWVVAQDWHAGGPNLYGHYFVDRPPLLMALYRLAVLSGWPPTIRLLATAFSVLLVVSAAAAARQVVGPRGVRWAALVAGAFTVTPLLMAQEADGEVFAAPLVMLSLALTLAAVRRRGRSALVTAVLAGIAAGAAVMVKQNFGDAVVFAVVLLVALLAQRRMVPKDAAVVAAGGVLGGGLVVGAALAFVAWSRVGLATAYQAVFGFRGTALDVIEDHSLHAPLHRAVEMTGLAVLAGALPLLVVLLSESVRCRFRGPPVAWAVGATAAFESVSIALGGSYWPHYVLQLAPVLALAAGLWAPDALRVRAAVLLTTVSAVVAAVVVTAGGTAYGGTAERVGAYLRASGRPGDTATVLFGNAEIQQTSGMGSPYDQLWTLPMRTLDPHLSRLRAVLRSPHAPTWVVAWGNLDPWNIDAHDRTRLALATHYRRVASVCGHQIYLHDGVRRPLLGPSTCR